MRTTSFEARWRALDAVTSERTPALLAEFYSTETNYAGATFAHLEPIEPDGVTATDLLAVTTLAINFPSSALRRILGDPKNRADLSEKLLALPNKKLEETDAADFVAMGEFYYAVKALLSRKGAKFSNPWVTTSKLVARKRPGLFPVRDSVVCSYLGIDRLGDYAKDWFVFREIMRSGEITAELARLPERVKAAAGKAPVDRDTEPLRLLDAALWRHGKLQEEEKS